MAEPIEPKTAEPQGKYEKLRRWLFGGLAALAVLGAVLRAAGVGKIDQDTLLFLLVAGVFLFLERIRKLSFGKEGLSLEVIEKGVQRAVEQGLAPTREQLADTRQVVVEGQRAAAYGVGGKGRGAAGGADAEAPGVGKSGAKLKLPKPTVDDDPQKGRFGGASEKNGRRLSADVTAARGFPGNYNVDLKVEATDAKPLHGKVTFYLHDSFFKPIQRATVVGGVAKLVVLAYGAFTVGAVADDGDTLLELDLAEDPRFPKGFREN